MFVCLAGYWLCCFRFNCGLCLVWCWVFGFCCRWICYFDLVVGVGFVCLLVLGVNLRLVLVLCVIMVVVGFYLGGWWFVSVALFICWLEIVLFDSFIGVTCWCF